MRRSARLVAAAGLLLLWTGVAGMALTLLPARQRRRQLPPLIRVLCRQLLYVLGVEVPTTGADAQGGALLVANHLSWIDVLAVLTQTQCTFVAKHEVRRWPLVGRLGQALGVIWIDRTRKRDLLRSIPLLADTLRRGERVLLFPEGTTSIGADVLPFRSSLIEAAVQAGTPVVPLVLSGHDEQGPCTTLAWVGSETLMAHLPRVTALRGARFSVHRLPSLPVGASRKVLSRLAREAIQDALRHPASAGHRTPVVRDTRETRVSGVLHQAELLRRTVTRVVRTVVGFAAVLLAAVLLVTSVLYATAPVYHDVPTATFRGTQWYNPYDGIDTQATATRWRTANFHAHSRAWAGLTNGRQEPSEVRTAYQRLGYDVIGISNYHALPAPTDTTRFPVYEHGWSISKSHRLVLGAEQVDWLDYPLGSTRHQRQHVLDRLHEHAALVAIAHPALRGGHSPQSVASLAGYDLIEVLNHFTAPADSVWDAALSSGHAVWLLANDDAHDITGTGETGTNFTRLWSPSNSTNDVLDALRWGRAYGVRAHNGRTTLALQSMHMQQDRLRVVVSGRIRTVTVVGQHGQQRAAWSRRPLPVDAAPVSTTDTVVTLTATAQPGDGYLRVVVAGDSEWLYTNPVVRWDGRELPRIVATVNWDRTILWRTSWLTAYAWLALLLGLRLQTVRQRRSASAAAVH